MENNFCCPQCGSKELQATTDVNGQFNVGAAYMGAKMLGPMGAMMGNNISSATVLVCSKCGKKFVAPDDIRQKMAAEKGKNRFLVGFCGVMAAISLIMAILLLSADVGIVAWLFFVPFTILFAVIAWAVINKEKKQKAALDELQAAMNRFK